MRMLIGSIIFLSSILLFAACSPPASEIVATAIVSKDSVIIDVPVQNHDSVWTWNTQPKDTIDHRWVVLMMAEKSMGRSLEGAFFIGLVHRSAGYPAVSGTVEELVDASRIVTWAVGEGKDGGESPHWFDTAIRPTYHDGVIRIPIYHWRHVERLNRYRPAKFRFLGVRADGSEYKGGVRVTNLKDPREQIARAISGPFTPDEYAIYQTVIDRAFRSPIERTRYPTATKFYVLNPSTHTGPFRGEPSQIENLGASDDVVQDYLAKRSAAADMSSLAAMGYRVMDADTLYAQRRNEMGRGMPWKLSVRVSAIGFNSWRNQALVYVETSSGNLGGEGFVVRLNKVAGEWLITDRVSLWIS